MIFGAISAVPEHPLLQSQTQGRAWAVLHPSELDDGIYEDVSRNKCLAAFNCILH